jgi:hypothetical protein
MKKKFDAAAIVLIILVIIRALDQFVIAATNIGTAYGYAYSFTGIIYIVSLVGLLMRKKWGAILILIFAIFDILAAVIFGGVAALGAAVVDLVIIWLAYKTYKADAITTDVVTAPPIIEEPK